MATRRTDKVYLWATWLSKLLGGDLECTWAAWFKGHYRYDKYEEMGGDLAKWNADHTRLMNQKKKALEQLGYVVSTEKENEFKIEGTAAVIAGKPDLVGRHPGNANVPAHTIVVDGKTGTRKHGDWWQVLIYLYALPKDWNRRGLTPVGELSGELLYAKGPDREELIDAAELTPSRMDDLVQMIKLVAGDEPPPRRPSREECKRCNIGPADCPDRVQKRQTVTTATDDF